MTTPTSPAAFRRGTSHSKDKPKDFILVSEFSELVGPVAVFTIPRNDDMKFDKASFSVRVLSSDLQANRKFTIVQDSQILQSIPNEEMYTHAYIHYMTLNDISARGYVRQYCMSYISRKERKLVENFLALKAGFEKVSTMLRCANLIMFFTDLLHRLKDLCYTADLIKEEGLVYDDTDNNPDFTTSQLYAQYDFCKDNVPEKDIKVVRQQIDEATEILNIVIDELNSPRNRRAIQYIDHGGSYSLEHIEHLISFIKQEEISELLKQVETDYEPRRTMAHTTYRFDRKLKPLSQLCGKYVFQNVLQELEHIQKKFNRQFFVLNIEEEESKILKPLSSLLTIGRTPVVNVLESKKFNGRLVSSKPKPYKFSSLNHLQADGGDQSFMHDDSSEADEYSFDTGFLHRPEYLETYPIYMDPISVHDLRSTNWVQNIEGSDLVLSSIPQSLSDQLISDPVSIPMSDQQEQFVTPQDSSPSLHSLSSNSSQPTTPTGNTVMDELNSDVISKPDSEAAPINTGISINGDTTIKNLGSEANERLNAKATSTLTELTSNNIGTGTNTGFVGNKQSTVSTAAKHLASDVDTEDTLRLNTNTGLIDDIIESGFVLLSHPEDFDGVDVEATLRPTNLATGLAQPSAAATTAGDDDRTHDILVPAHMRVVGIHGNNTSDIGIHGNSQGNLGLHSNYTSIQIEERVVGIATDVNSINYPINTDLPSTGALNDRRSRATLPKLKLPYGAASPEYHTPTDRLPKDPLSPLPSAKSPIHERPVVRVAGNIPLISYSDQCTRHSKLRPGRKILDFIKNYPNCQDFFYALLSGRPLVISGPSTMEPKIRNVVMTLWMFVPGYSSQYQVIPWHKEPIKLQDLQHFKLIGHCNDGHTHHVIPQHILPYISWWNYRDGKLYTPRYDGSLLNSICRRTDWKSEPMLIAHIHSVLLDIASKAFVYYHLYCVAKQQKETRDLPLSPASTPSQPTPLRPRVHSASKVFPKLNIDKQCDKDIIQYFSEVIIRQQLAEWDETSLSKNTGIKLNYKKCAEQSCRAY